MNQVLDQIVRAVAAGKVTRRIELLAKRLVDHEKRQAELAAARARPAALEHADARRRREDLEEDAAKRRMHDEVWSWNCSEGAGRCDCGCGYAFRHATEGECDHWIERSQGGEHTRENGWRLRSECHDAKTNNRPGRASWNARRQTYCERAGIPFVPRRER
jgi:5-methylcytosine-specific restriction endonuclease McrA